MNKNHMSRIIIGTALILSIPLIGMLFTDEIDWNLADFIVIGTLLIGTGLMYEFIASRVRSRNQRILLGLGLLLTLAVVWAELAVGIFGSPIAGS